MAEERSPIHIRLYRAHSWMKRAEKLVAIDPDGCFIFYWVAFNALYGQPRYLSVKRNPNEETDFEEFLDLTYKLDTANKIREKLTEVRMYSADLLTDAYLNKDCWEEWSQRSLATVDQRRWYGPRDKKRGTDLFKVFQCLYVLRNQVFHGCSADGSTKNRDTLAKAINVMRTFVPLFHDLIQTNQTDPSVLKLLGNLPYPPSIGGTG